GGVVRGDGFVHLRDVCGQQGEVGVAAALGAEFGGSGFQDTPYFQQSECCGACPAAALRHAQDEFQVSPVLGCVDVGSPTAFDPDDVLGPQHFDRLADGQTADVGCCGDLGFRGQGLVHGEFTAHHLVEQAVGQAVGQTLTPHARIPQ